MVIKKPYAFLIKHFRLIHGLLFAMLLYLLTRNIDIYSFFNSYAVSHAYINIANLADSYVNALMYIITILVIFVTFVIFFILSMKDKGNRLYLAGILYYIVLLIFYIYIKTVFVGLQNNQVLDIETIRALRDVSLIVLLPQIPFIFIIFGRTLGFNLKQFEFKKDLEELEIDTSDNEEVELTLGNDTYKIARFFRKFLRLSKYFVLENRLFVIASTSLVILVISVVIYSKVNVYQQSYSENEQIQAHSLFFSVNESYKTTSDLNNIVIRKGKHYVLVNTNITNKYASSYNVNRDTFKLQTGEELLLPIFSLSDKFYDIGEVFSPFEIKAGESKDCIVVFEVDDQYDAKDYLFKIKNFTFNENVPTNTYKDIIVKPIDLNVAIDKGTFKMPNTINLSDSLLKNSSILIESIDIADKFKEKFKYTINNQEKEAIYSIIPSETNKGSMIIVRIKSKVTLDESAYVSKLIKSPVDLYNMYGIIRYRYQGEYYTAKLSKLKVDFESETYSYLEIPKEIENANRIDFILLIRGTKYTINLK